MGEKIAKTGLKRDKDLLYFIRGGDVWAAARRKPGNKKKGKAFKVADFGVDMDYSKYLYYLDADGDIARQKRRIGGRKKSGRTSRGTAMPKGGKAAASTRLKYAMKVKRPKDPKVGVGRKPQKK